MFIFASLLGLLYLFFSIFSLICAGRHISKSNKNQYMAVNDDEMSELNTPYMGDKYGSTSDSLDDPDSEQKKTML